MSVKGIGNWKEFCIENHIFMTNASRLSHERFEISYSYRHSKWRWQCSLIFGIWSTWWLETQIIVSAEGRSDGSCAMNENIEQQWISSVFTSNLWSHHLPNIAHSSRRPAHHVKGTHLVQLWLRTIVAGEKLCLVNGGWTRAPQTTKAFGLRYVVPWLSTWQSFAHAQPTAGKSWCCHPPSRHFKIVHGHPSYCCSNIRQ